MTNPEIKQSDVNGAPQAIIESPLLRLPPELRNIIFAYALDHGTVSPHLGTTCLERRLRKDPIRKRFGLLFTCRQIYAETALLPYKLNTFSVRGLIPLVALENFLGRRTQAQMQVMDKVQMDYEEVRAATVWMEKIAKSTDYHQYVESFTTEEAIEEKQEDYVSKAAGANPHRNATVSPLLRLPPELRNTIFAYALDYETFILEHLVPRIRTTGSRHKDPINLLYVCRQIYIETALLPYKLNRFVIWTEDSRNLVTFLKGRTSAQIEVMSYVARRYTKYFHMLGWRHWTFMSATEWIDPSHDYGMSSPKKRSEGAKPDLAPLAHPMPNEIVDSTPDRSTELAIASHPAAARDEISQRNADSPLLRLPAELRNHIFAFALTQGDIKWNYGTWLKNKNSVNLLYLAKSESDFSMSTSKTQRTKYGTTNRLNERRDDMFVKAFYNPTLTERNATLSPLLRLPPEIRNHIFSLALNHGYIPIIFPERSHRWKIKRAERRGFEYRYHYKQFCNFFYNPISFSGRSCSFKLKKRPVRNLKRLNHLKRPVNLLFVCRQIHAETALLPYKVNTWVIELNRPWERIREGTQRNAKSPLLRLPAELRNQIFALALTFSEITIYYSPERGELTIHLGHSNPSTFLHQLWWTISATPNTNADANMDLKPQSEEARAHITQHNATASPLLRLPAEIRNMIFAYALNHGDIELKVIPRIINEPSRKGCWKHRNWAGPFNISLLYACRQIYFETALLPYELNIFVVSGNDSAFQDFFGHRTLEQVGALARVRRQPDTRLGARPATEWLERLKLPSTNPNLSMSLPEEQHKDSSSTMTSSETQTEEIKIEEDPKDEVAEQEQRLNNITHLNATTSPLLLLPGEIRNMIYALALDHKDIRIFKGRAIDVKHPINLLYVCRQAHAETALLPYAINCFAIVHEPIDAQLRFIARSTATLHRLLKDRTQAQIGVMMKVRRLGELERFAQSATEWMKTAPKAS
ncbi:uncharacterized protein J4E87_009863 [Alternaria ethzedia]|uniref:uncharacterized protein n=1 Tax=Alternaria ethzedia TaxID=181014 RepID=UPI0020C5606E|nr:uncharacterized protein J4E87_009863 [Alternaria ethzedia]KAI4613396.1 hypothetical protein J4E87_009863 [Alternaria ethzedia]